jgi:hypothetical protein
MTAIGSSAQPAVATRLLAGVAVPDTPLISRAIEFARDRSEPYLFNHVMRSWLFAVIIAQRQRMAHDAEVLAVTTILHDLGLAEAFCRIVETRPTTTYDNFARDFGERFVPGYKPASTVDYLLNSPFKE